MRIFGNPVFPLSKEGWEVARRTECRHTDAMRLLEMELYEGRLKVEAVNRVAPK